MLRENSSITAAVAVARYCWDKFSNKSYMLGMFNETPTFGMRMLYFKKNAEGRSPRRLVQLL